MVVAVGDAELLAKVLDSDDLSDGVRAAFEDMQHKVERFGLSKKQREWARTILAGGKYVPPEEYLNLVSGGQVPRGREVATPVALRRENLPMKPPPRRPVK